MIPLIVYDRSRVTTDWTCKRKRYLQYEFDGKGIVNNNTNLDLYMGTLVHEALAAIAKGTDLHLNIDDIARMQYQAMYKTLLQHMAGENEYEAINFASEQATLVEGLIRGFYKHVWPQHLARYPKTLAIEQEMKFEHDDLVFMSKPDRVAEDTEGNVWYIEYKTTSNKKDTWINSWDTAVQLHSSIRAIEATLGVKVTGVVVQGLYKGFESYGKQSSPFCYAYHRQGNPPFTQTETIYEYRAGFKRIPTWELPEGVKGWVDGMPDTVLADQFPQAPPIFVNGDLVDSFFTQRAWREKEIFAAKQYLKLADESGRKGVMDVAFPQTFEECNPGWGSPCQYRKICHGGLENPLEHGYEYRTPHHELELELQND